ncbi:group 1 truncated hemoglobin [Streptomyces sp. 7-21]|jgi:hemoglobin|uniref:group I truncated hemoglobin n=1 Tax=Streptomyces sp. 7-21 TaxID=2802283 RepID=UPI00191D1B4E|nr:group 1 truncated hemoglobin [Streptomyces sp. 7-21]MBL1065405.1 group 1 truncated hemoglobin [Streptomyces sp. 7-21]
MTHPSTADQHTDSGTLFEQLGGDDAVAAVVDSFYGKVLADESLQPYFDGVDLERLKTHQRRFIGQALGSTRPYSGRSMRKAHGHLGISDADFDRVVTHLAAALTEAGVDTDTIGVIADKLAPLRADIVTAGAAAPEA